LGEPRQSLRAEHDQPDRDDQQPLRKSKLGFL
jgi:hypothetical protein